MSGLRARERLRIGRLRAARVRAALPAWDLMSSTIERLVLVPIDLVTADPSFLGEAAAGQFGLAGSVVDVGAGSPFTIERADPRWLAELHGFAWLRHLRVAGGPEAIRLARDLVADWMTNAPRRRGPAWQPEVMAARITAWTVNAGLLLDGADPRFYDVVLRDLGLQIRRLDASRHRAPPGLPRLRCLIALLQAALATEAENRHVHRLERELVHELGRQVLSDGCPLSRNPGEGLALLALLLPIRQGYLERHRPLPAQLATTIGRLFAFLEHMRLGDGTLGRFNGMGRTPGDLLATVGAFFQPTGSGTGWGTPGGYVRLERGQTVLMVDAGRAPPLEHAGCAHGGCLSIEMSVGAVALLRNCAAPGAGSSAHTQTAARATASHNTLSVDGRSSARLIRSRRVEELVGASPLVGPRRVTCSVIDGSSGVTIAAEHDGYLDGFGLLHWRRLTLSADGRRLDGIDRIGGAAGDLRLAFDLPFAIHFHLASEISARIDGTGKAATLAFAGGPAEPNESWRLTAVGARLSLEASCDNTHASSPLATRQLVLRGACPGEATVEWTLAAVDPVPARAQVSPGGDLC